MNKRIVILTLASVLLQVVLVASLTSAFFIDKNVSYQCGLEAVVPCVQYEATTTGAVNIYKVFAVISLAILFVVSLTMLMRILFRRNGESRITKIIVCGILILTLIPSLLVTTVPVASKSLICRLVDGDGRYSIIGGQYSEYESLEPVFPGPTQGVCAVEQSVVKLYVL